MKPMSLQHEVVYIDSEPTEQAIKQSYAQKWSLYKITKEQFLALAEAQDFKCLVCRGDAKGVEHLLCVDHDHYTNEIRGLLCFNCNTATGWLEENPEYAENLAHYLRTSGTGVYIPYEGS